MSIAFPDVDVLLVTYNHEDYVARALEGILYQEYEGKIRIVVADDCSTDGTVELIREFALAQPRFEILLLPSNRNIGVTANYERGFSSCKSDLVAVLEGDDYWCSTKKLAKQVAFLQEHRECIACACNYYVMDEARHSYELRVDGTDGYLSLTAQALILDNVIGNFSTCLYRRSVLKLLPNELFQITSYDWIVNICCAMHGVIGFLCEPLSVYRQHASGVWSGSRLESKISRQLALIPLYDNLTRGAFAAEFEALRASLLSGSSDPVVELRRRRSLPKRLANSIQKRWRKAVRAISRQKHATIEFGRGYYR